MATTPGMCMDEEEKSPTFLPYDIILTEILPRLHIKPLFTFKCTSKQYESVISHPVFARNYMQRASSKSFSSSGILPTLMYPFTNFIRFRNQISVKNLSNTLNSITQCRDDQVFVSSVSLPYHNMHKILSSSNGLILSCFNPNPNRESVTVTLCVSNPLTKECVKLPESGVELSSHLWVFGIATRCAPLLTYKIVAIYYHFLYKASGYYTTVQIFSSDTGKWATWKTSPSHDIYYLPTDGPVVHKGALYFLNSCEGMVTTYDPYDNPDRLNRIPLPNAGNGGFSCHSCLIYSGDKETLKYCEVDDTSEGESCVDRFWVWRLVDSELFELEGEFVVPSVMYKCKILMVAPNAWNRDLICHPYVMIDKFTVVNLRTGKRKMVGVFDEETSLPPFPTEFLIDYTIYRNPLIMVELCPWSSPCYAQAQANTS